MPSCNHSTHVEGHDFVDATRNQSFWIKTKAYVTKNLPGWTLSVFKEVAERVLKGEIHLWARPGEKEQCYSQDDPEKRFS